MPKGDQGGLGSATQAGPAAARKRTAPMSPAHFLLRFSLTPAVKRVCHSSEVVRRDVREAARLAAPHDRLCSAQNGGSPC